MTKTPAWLRRRLLDAATHLYRPFAWRSERNPFWGLVAEVLLAKTPAARVEPIWVSLRRDAKSPRGLLAIKERKLQSLLRPLGLQVRRARQLRGLAEEWARGYRPVGDGVSETTHAGNGVGPYARAAYLTFFVGVPTLPVDANVKRVLTRLLGRTDFDKKVEKFGNAAMPTDALEGRRFAYALLDLAGTTCLARNPHCLECPLLNGCKSAPRLGTAPVEPER